MRYTQHHSHHQYESQGIELPWALKAQSISHFCPQKLTAPSLVCIDPCYCCVASGLPKTVPQGLLREFVFKFLLVNVVVVQLLRCVRLFVTHGLQHSRLPCPSLSPTVCSNPCPLSRWCHPAISSSVVPSPPALSLYQHQGLLQSQFFASGGRSIGVSASTSVLPMNIQDWFLLEWTGLISLQSKELSRVFSNYLSIVNLQCCVSFRGRANVSQLYMYMYSLFFRFFPIYAIIEYWVESPVLTAGSYQFSVLYNVYMPLAHSGLRLLTLNCL